MLTEKITAVILAGGRASRMGGNDKGLLPFKDRPLIEHILSAIESKVDNIIINANRNLDQYRRYGYPVISDEIADFAGPLAGILASMRAATTDAIITLPCDTPFISSDYIERMHHASTGASGAIACHDGEIEPLFVLLPCTLEISLSEYLASGRRKARDWMASIDSVEVDFSDRIEMFKNFNTPDELNSTGAVS